MPRLPSIKTIREKTEFKDPKTAKAAQETLAWLEAGAPHKLDGLDGQYKFDMGQFVDDRRGCGTACCIAGAIHAIRTGGFDKGVHLPASELYKAFDIQRFSRSSLRDLFFAYDEDGDQLSFDSITPAQAATTLRHYLTTGEVKW